MRKTSAKERIRQFLRANIGTMVTAHEIKAAAGPDVSEWARRVRELRDEEGWPIITNNDSSELKPGQYILVKEPSNTPRVRFARSISAKLRAQVLDRNGFTCQMCGLCPGDIDPSTGRKVRLHLGHIKDKSLGGEDILSNLQALCASCNQGAKNVTGEKPTAIWLLSQVRRANLDDQRTVFYWLKKKFNDVTDRKARDSSSNDGR